MRFEVTVIRIDIDPQCEFFGIAFRVELGGVDVLTDADENRWGQ